MNELKKTIGLFSGIAFAFSIVVGAGMVLLPGLVYAKAGGLSALSWLLDGVIALPMLVIFILMGRDNPTAGGVSGYIGSVWPRARPGIAYILLGAFSLGLPAVSMTGAIYLIDFLPIENTRANLIYITLAIVAFSVLFNLLGAKMASAIQTIIVSGMILLLLAVSLLAVPGWKNIDFNAGNPTYLDMWDGMALAFFAFTGFEMLSFMSEEFKNPKRDLPIIILGGLFLITIFYILVALAVMAYIPHQPVASGDLLVPLKAVLENIFIGNASDDGMTVISFVSVVVGVMILLNLNGAVWAASRLIFDISREGYLPRPISYLKDNLPKNAILTLAGIFSLVLILYALEILEIDFMIKLATQNFFLIYVFTIIAYFKKTPSPIHKAMALVALAISIAFGAVYGWGLLYPALLASLPYIFFKRG